MITYDEAVAQILAHSPLAPAEPCAGHEALDRVLAAPVHSPVDLPGFDNSAMDGYALACGADGLAAGSEWPLVGQQAAGDPDRPIAGGAVEIMTGARIPQGLNAVVPVEQVESLGARIRLKANCPLGAHIRRAGEDIAEGELAMAAGELISAQHLMLLAALGVAEVSVRRRPKLALICTGRELIDDPGTALASGQIRNSNGPFLATRLCLAGAELVLRRTVTDSVEAYLAAVTAALEAGAELILSTGAVSMGRYDFVPEALGRLGARTLFHKTAIRPGKPILVALLPGGQRLFGLPGNPVSCAVGLRFFLEPALRAQLGLPPALPLQVPLAADTRKKPGLRFFQKARLDFAADGRARVSLLAGQESFRIRPLLAANAWAELPEAAEHLPAGTPVAVHSLGGLASFWPEALA